MASYLMAISCTNADFYQLYPCTGTNFSKIWIKIFSAENVFCKMVAILLRSPCVKSWTSTVICYFVDSLRPSDAIWRHKTGSTLAQVMACCLTAPSHYLNQCWLINSKVYWHSFEGNFTAGISAVNHCNWLKFHWNLPGHNELSWSNWYTNQSPMNKSHCVSHKTGKWFYYRCIMTLYECVWLIYPCPFGLLHWLVLVK